MYKKNFRTEMFILQLDIRACKNKYIRCKYILECRNMYTCRNKMKKLELEDYNNLFRVPEAIPLL